MWNCPLFGSFPVPTWKDSIILCGLRNFYKLERSQSRLLWLLFSYSVKSCQPRSADMCFYSRIKNSKMRQKTFLRACIFFLNSETGGMLRGMQSGNKGQSTLPGWNMWFNQDIWRTCPLFCMPWIWNFKERSPVNLLSKSPHFVITVYYRLKSHCLVQSVTTTFQEVALNIFPLNHFLSRPV